MCGHREKLAIYLQAKERGCRRNDPASTLILDFWPPEQLSEPPTLFQFVGAALTNSYRGYLKKNSLLSSLIITVVYPVCFYELKVFTANKTSAFNYANWLTCSGDETSLWPHRY